MENLQTALENRDDFILTWEREEDEGKYVMHLFSGSLITPCMRGTLTNRVELGICEGSSHIRFVDPDTVASVTRK